MTELLDKIETKEKTRYGIIDYSNRKQIFFYDLTHNNDPQIRLLLTLWRTQEDDLLNRFSLFAAINFPTVELPEKRIIPKNSIENLDDLTIPDVEQGVTQSKFTPDPK